MKIDLLNGKMWRPSNGDMVRWYFGKDFIQVNIYNSVAYYKTSGFDIENESEVRSQLSYYTNVECSNIYASKY